MLIGGLAAFPVVPTGVAEQLARASSAFTEVNATAQKLAQIGQELNAQSAALRAAFDDLTRVSRSIQQSPSARAEVFFASVNRRGRRVTHNGTNLETALGRVALRDLDALTTVLYRGRAAIADALASEWVNESPEVLAALLVMLSVLDDLDAVATQARLDLSTCRPNRQTRRAKTADPEPQGHRQRTPQPRAVCAHHRRHLATVSTNDDPADSLSSLGAMSPHLSSSGGITPT